jgi:hypothetical protein
VPLVAGLVDALAEAGIPRSVRRAAPRARGLEGVREVGDGRGRGADGRLGRDLVADEALAALDRFGPRPGS